MQEALKSESKVSRRLTERTAQEVCSLIYEPRLSNFADVFPYLTEVNEAHLLMLYKQGLIPAGAASALAVAMLDMVRQGPGQIELDPQREDAYFNYEAHLIGKTGPDVGGRLHTARSRNDILATIDRLVARDRVIQLLDVLIRVRETALDRADAYKEVVMPGYTHLQPAQPITYGFYLAGVAQTLERDSSRLAQAYARINKSPLGAGALAGTPFTIDRDETARLLGFDGVIDNTLDAVASRDFMFETMAALTLLATTWSRIAQDYFVWGTDEFRLIDFPDSVAGTSSIMPQKKNPVVLEYLKGRSGKIIGLFTGAVAGLKGTNFSHTGDANRESIAGFGEMIRECLDGLVLLNLVLSSARPLQESMLQRARQNFCSATDLADMLVKEAGISFRESHHVVGAVVREAMDKKLSADQITAAMVEKAYTDQIGCPPDLAEGLVNGCLDPQASVEKRQAGGPAAGSVAKTLGRLKEALENDRRLNEARKQAVEQRRGQLVNEMTELAQA
ncbi:MAG: argininosuccinate lyase [Burkholderiaceae bacterium]